MVTGAGSDREESRGGGGLFRLLCFTLHGYRAPGVVWCGVVYVYGPARRWSREREVVEQDEAVAHCLHLTATPSSDDVLEQLV